MKMSRIEREIGQNMSGFDIDSGKQLTAAFVFPEDFIGFQGHFPVQKILPAACQIQCVLAVLEKWKGRDSKLKEIVQAKFLSPVFPLEQITFVCKIADIGADEGLNVNVFVSGKEKKISEFKLKVSFI